MTDSNFPTDFFEDHSFGKKARRPRFLDKYSERRFLPYIRVPVEYSVIAGIAVLVFLVVAYAIGVERGKRISAVGMPCIRREGQQVPALKEIPGKEGIEESAGIPGQDGKGAAENSRVFDKGGIADTPVLLQGEEMPESGETVRGVPGPGYLIQLVSFRKEKYARKEVKKLREMGKKASFARKGVWYQVYAEGYRTAEEACGARDAFKEKYPDCYIRRQK